MSGFGSKPTYAPIDSNPSVGKVVANFTVGDVATWGAVTAVSAPLGYAMGKPVRGPAAVLAGGMGLVAGFSSRTRTLPVDSLATDGNGSVFFLSLFLLIIPSLSVMPGLLNGQSSRYLSTTSRRPVCGCAVLGHFVTYESKEGSERDREKEVKIGT